MSDDTPAGLEAHSLNTRPSPARQPPRPTPPSPEQQRQQSLPPPPSQQQQPWQLPPRPPPDQRRRRRRQQSSVSSASGNRGPPERAGTVARKINAVMGKRLRFYTDLMTNLDMLIYAEICTLYYMDCSVFRLFLRMTGQTMCLSDSFSLFTPSHRPHLVAIALPNAVCALLHFFAPLAGGSEASRGYLHGGVFIDFIGQRAPTARYGLLLLDLLVLLLQCLMLAVHAECEDLRKKMGPPPRTSQRLTLVPTGLSGPDDPASPPPSRSRSGSATAGRRSRQPTMRDHDAEERGVLPRPAGPPRNMRVVAVAAAASAAAAAARAGVETSHGIEMQALTGGNGVTGGIGRSSSRRGSSSHLSRDVNEGAASGIGNSDGLDHIDHNNDDNRREPALPERDPDFELDALNSGGHLSDFYVIYALREAGRNIPSTSDSSSVAGSPGSSSGAAAQSLQSMGYALALFRLATGRGLRAQTVQ